MKYIPQQLIKKSRFRDYFLSLEKEEQERTLGILERLILENSEYTDEKNYGHLCNLLTSLALVQMHEQSGKTRQESQEMVANAMYRFIEPQKKAMKKLASHGWFVPVLKKVMPAKFGRNLGYGWDVILPKAPKDEFVMITRKCIFYEIFSKYGMPEMTAKFCKVDDILYGALKRAEFLYTGQIGTGGKQCDYTFRKK